MKAKPIIITIVLLLFGILSVNTLLGNPVSKQLAERAAKEYLSENFPSLDVYMESITFDAKTANYDVNVKSSSCIDTYFIISTNMIGDVLFDTYQNDVLSGYNTYQRINRDYEALVDSVMKQATLPYTLRWCLGNLEIIYPENVPYSTRAHISMDTLQLNENYDIYEFGSSVGYLSIAIIDESITFDRMAEFMLDIKARFEAASVPFYAVSMTIQSSAEPGQVSESINVTDFLYSDIYADELAQRLQAYS